MTRVKRGTIANKRRRNVLSRAKGYRFGRKSKERLAKVAVTKAGAYAFAHRKDRKNDFRRLWNVRINAFLRPLGHTYSTFIGTLKKQGVLIDRKILADLAKNHPESLKRIVSKTTK